jgi:glycerophosphoryl diester phosphodiesterase
MQDHPYFKAQTPVVLAHRGGSSSTENTLETFTTAIKAGVFSIETDVRTTKDGVAVLFHDADLKRVAGLDQAIAEIDWNELQKIVLVGGGKIPTLVQALTALPQARFNLDIKDEASVQSTVNAIESTNSHERVLVSSFSNKRRLSALRILSKRVATSASASTVISLWVLHVLRLPKQCFARKLKGIGAIQIPRGMYGIKLDSKRFISKVRSTGTHVHYWTINNPQEMLELTMRGATGIVSDMSELAVQTLRKA